MSAVNVSPSTTAALNTWAAQKRRTLIESTSVPCVMATIKTERVAAGSGSGKGGQHWPEVYTGDGAVVQSIVQEFRELPRLTLTFYYVLRWPWRVPVPYQAAELGVGKRDYWQQLRTAEEAIETSLRLLASPAIKAIFSSVSVRTPLTG